MKDDTIFYSVVTIMIILGVVASTGAILLGTEVKELKCQLEYEKDNLNAEKYNSNYWKDLAHNWEIKYINYECPPCPEPETEYIYNNETIYDNHTIYLSTDIFDVTRDGRVDYQDVCSVYGYVQNGLSSIEELFYGKYPNPYEKLYDVNIDGIVNLDDVELILKYSS